MRLSKLFDAFVSIILISCSFLFAQESTKESGWLELERQIDVPAEVTQWYVFPEKQIAITSREMILYQEGGSQTIPLPPHYLKTVFSKNGRFAALVTLNPRDSVEPIDRDLTISVISISDPSRELYHINRKVYFDRVIPSISVIGDNGSVIVGESDIGQLWFYDQNGNLVTQIMLFTDAEYDLEKILDIDVNEDGSRVAVIAGKRGGSPAGSDAVNPNAEPHLFFFTGQGMEIWRKALPDFNSNEVAISPDGQLIVANSFTIFTNGRLIKKTVIFNAEGQHIFTTDLLFKHARFSPDSRYVLLAENNQLQLVDAVQGESLWRQKISRQNGIFIDGAVSGQNGITAVLIAGISWENDQYVSLNPHVVLFNLKGQSLQRIEYTDQKALKPGLCFGGVTESLLVALGNSYQIFRLK